MPWDAPLKFLSPRRNLSRVQGHEEAGPAFNTLEGIFGFTGMLDPTVCRWMSKTTAVALSSLAFPLLPKHRSKFR